MDTAVAVIDWRQSVDRLYRDDATCQDVGRPRDPRYEPRSGGYS